jgi:hypothetical protein
MIDSSGSSNSSSSRINGSQSSSKGRGISKRASSGTGREGNSDPCSTGIAATAAAAGYDGLPLRPLLALRALQEVAQGFTATLLSGCRERRPQ